jgi:hypothetical protein
MKYVIDCTPEQLKFIKEILGEDANRADVKFWESPICIALGEARPLSDICEAEAKRHEVADYGSSNSPMLQEWGRADKEIAAAFRSFGSK